LPNNEYSEEYIIENSNGVLNEKFTNIKGLVEYAFNFICDYNAETDKYSLNSKKVVKAISLALLNVKGDFYLQEFITALKAALDLALPIDSDFDLSCSDPNQNLFEGY